MYVLCHMTYTLKNGFENVVRLYCVIVIELIVFHGFFVNVQFQYCVLMSPLFVKV
jgi:hypothetical protein